MASVDIRKGYSMLKRERTLKKDPRFAPGARFGEWTVIDGPHRYESNAYVSYRFMAQCSCGYEGFVWRGGFVYGTSSRCRACSNLKRRSKVSEGDVFGSVTVIGKAAELYGVYWRQEVQCSCGNVFKARITNLLIGRTTSCKKCSFIRRTERGRKK